MSRTPTRQFRDSRSTCHDCRSRKARFQYRGRVQADADHTLCFECFRAERERQRARQLAEAASGDGAASRGPEAPAASGDTVWPAGASRFDSLTERQIAHRRVMLANLAARRAGYR